MPKHFSLHHSQLAAKFASIDRTRRKMERLASKALITRQDIERVYEGLFIKTVVSFEENIEELFLGILTGTVSYPSRIAPRIGSLTRTSARLVVLGGKSYVDWLPIHHTTARAKVFLRGGRPFSEITRVQKQALSKISAIRNAIAHPSASAKKRFENEVLAGLILTPHERSLGGYLRSVYRTSPIQTRFEATQFDCLDVLGTICR